MKAANLDSYINFPRTKTTIPNLNNNLQINATSVNFPQIVNNPQEARRVISFYDQMFPHYIIQNSLSPFTRHCFVIVKENLNNATNWKVFHIVSTLNWRRDNRRWNATGRVTCVGSSLKDQSDNWRALVEILENQVSIQPDDLIHSLLTKLTFNE